MDKRIEDYYSKIGYLITLASEVESELEFFISNYFVSDKSSKTFFFKELMVFKLDFERKVRTFQKICKKEKFDDIEIKKIIKSIKNVQKIRNKVAHWQLEVTIDNKIGIKNRSASASKKELQVLDSALIKKINEERLFAVRGMIKYYKKFRKDGTFESKSNIDLSKESWDYNYNALLTYIKKETKFPSMSSKDKFERDLGKWCNYQRMYYVRKSLNKLKISLLEKVPYWFWNRSEKWDATYDKLKEFIEIHKRLPTTRELTSTHRLISKEEKYLFRWCKEERRKYLGTSKIKKKITKKQIKLLQELDGWYWIGRKGRGHSSKTKKLFQSQLFSENQWNETFNVLSKFVKKNKRFPDWKKRHNDNLYVAWWIWKQRHTYKNRLLSKEKIGKLESLNNWTWDVKKTSKILWSDQHQELKDFIVANNRLPNRKKNNKDDKSLLSWMDRQRYNFFHDKLSKERIIKMENLKYWYWKKD